jgi:hypothetical protein
VLTSVSVTVLAQIKRGRAETGHSTMPFPDDPGRARSTFPWRTLFCLMDGCLSLRKSVLFGWLTQQGAKDGGGPMILRFSLTGQGRHARRVSRRALTETTDHGVTLLTPEPPQAGWIESRLGTGAIKRIGAERTLATASDGWKRIWRQMPKRNVAVSSVRS